MLISNCKKNYVGITTINTFANSLLIHYVMNLLGLLRIIALLEGVSFIALLGVGMPLKYISENESIVKALGMPHGVLFVAYLAVVFLIREDQKWNIKTTLILVLASILPFGTFYADYKYFRKNP